MEIKPEPESYRIVFDTLIEKLGIHSDERKRNLIIIDGDMGIGKTSLSNWLACQFGTISLHADQYTIRKNWTEFEPYNLEELKYQIQTALEQYKILFFEGIYSTKLVDMLSLNCDILIHVKKPSDKWGRVSSHPRFSKYLESYNHRLENSDVTVSGFAS